MSESPKVSVVLPAYNAGRFLGPCLAGLLNQSLSDLEVIVVDDGSEDNTREIVLDIAQRDDRVRYVYQQNAGSAAARNRAIELARGEFLALQDADDLSEPTRFSRQVEALVRNPECVAVGCSALVISATNSVIGRLNPPSDAASVARQLQSRMAFVHPTLMIRRSSLGEDLRYDVSLATSEDFDFVRRLVQRGPAWSLNDPLYFYRMSGTQLTMSGTVQGAIRSALVAQGRASEASGWSRAEAVALGLDGELIDRAVIDRLEYALRLNRVCRNQDALKSVLKAAESYLASSQSDCTEAKLRALLAFYDPSVRTLRGTLSKEFGRVAVREIKFLAHMIKTRAVYGCNIEESMNKQ